MLTVKRMKQADRAYVMPRVKSFYQSDAVTHAVPELFIEPELRGQGLGHAFFDWLFSAYPDAARFRLEVTPENSRAAALYKRMGFEPLTYCQMIRE